MELHQRGVDLLLKVMDAADQVEKLEPNQTQALLREFIEVLSTAYQQVNAVSHQRPR